MISDMSIEARNLYPISIDVPRKGEAHHWNRDRPWSVKGSMVETQYSRSTPWGGEKTRVWVSKLYFEHEEAALFEIARQLKDYHSQSGNRHRQRDRKPRPCKRIRDAGRAEREGLQ